MGREKSKLIKYHAGIVFFVIIILTFLAYSNTFTSPFLFDDFVYIVDNEMLRDLSSLWPPGGTRYFGYLSFALNYHFNGLEVWGYHLVNIFIHIANALLAYCFVFFIFKTPVMNGFYKENKGVALAVALSSSLVFAMHPIETQAVTYITQRFASLATFFYLLSVVAYLGWRTTEKKHRHIFFIISLASAICAQMTKEISFTLPFMLLVLEFLFFGYSVKGVLRLLPFLATLAIIPIFVLAPHMLPFGLGSQAEFLRAHEVKDLAVFSKYEYLITQFRVIVAYLRLMVLPIGQNVDHDIPRYTSFLNHEVLASFVFLLVFFAAFVYLLCFSSRKKEPLLLLASAGLAWFFITLSIESSVIPIADVMFEHRMYLPSLGFFIAFMSLFAYIVSRINALKERQGTAILALSAVILIPLGVTAHARNAVWKDALTINMDVVAKSPKKARARISLGHAYHTLGDLDRAIEEYELAFTLGTTQPTMLSSLLGDAYGAKRDYQKAIEYYSIALNRSPGNNNIRLKLADAYYRLGKYEEAISEYETVLAFDPKAAHIYLKLAGSYQAMGVAHKAIENYNNFIVAEPASELRPRVEAAIIELGKKPGRR